MCAKYKVAFKDDAISFRKLSVVDDKVIWPSGNKGNVIRSVDGGQSWKTAAVKTFERTDFKDISFDHQKQYNSNRKIAKPEWK